jgi:hypothetical protein
MTGYRRNFIPGGSFFFTVNLVDRRLRLLTENIDELTDRIGFAALYPSYNSNKNAARNWAAF